MHLSDALIFDNKLSEADAPPEDEMGNSTSGVQNWVLGASLCVYKRIFRILDFAHIPAKRFICYASRISRVSPYFTRPPRRSYRTLSPSLIRRDFIRSAAAKQSWNTWKIWESKRRCAGQRVSRNRVWYDIYGDCVRCTDNFTLRR